MYEPPSAFNVKPKYKTNSPKSVGLGGQSSRFKADPALTANCNYTVTVNDIGAKKTVVKQLRLSPSESPRSSKEAKAGVSRSEEWLVSNKDIAQVPGNSTYS